MRSRASTNTAPSMGARHRARAARGGGRAGSRGAPRKPNTTTDPKIIAERCASVEKYICARARHWRFAWHLLDSDDEDLASEGRIGALRAAQTFDTSRGVKFLTFASWQIEAHIRRWLQQHQRLIAVPVRFVEQRRKLLDTLDCGDFQSANLHARLSLRTIDIDAPSGDDGRVLSELLGDDSPSPEELLVEHAAVAELDQVLDVLEPRERMIMQHRAAGLTLQQIASKLRPPVSRERVRQIEAVALAKLRRAVTKGGR